MKFLNSLLFFIAFLNASPMSAQWYYDNMGTVFSGSASLPWVNTTSACNPPGVTNLGVTVTGEAGSANWFGGWDGVSTGSTSSGGALCWFGQVGGSNVAGNSTVTYTYTMNVTGSVTISSATFGVRKNSIAAPNLTTFTINGTSYTPSVTTFPLTTWYPVTVTVSPAKTVTASTLTIVIGFTGGNAAGSSGMIQRIDELKLFGSSAAPVELTDFTVKPTPIGFDLNWKTATEQDNDYFSIERSVDGRTFASIGQVKGAGTTIEEHSYTFTDRSPLKGYNYYRLKQVDYDGKSEYSPVRSVKVGSGSTATLSPNPIQQGSNATLILDTANEDDLTIEIYNTLGQAVLRQQTTVSKGINPIQLDILALPKGVYTLLTRVGTESSESQQFIIQ